jgi:hypothetical protein
MLRAPAGALLVVLRHIFCVHENNSLVHVYVLRVHIWIRLDLPQGHDTCGLHINL